MALPLAEAADRLGLSPNALRMRVARGRAEGERRDGRLYVYVDAPPASAPRPAATETGQSDYGTIVELQRTELNRLLAENRRLSERLDGLLTMLQEEQASRHALQHLFGEVARRQHTPDPAGWLGRLTAWDRSNRSLRNAVLRMAESFERGTRATTQVEFDRRLRALEMDAATARLTLAEISDHLRTKRGRSQN